MHTDMASYMDSYSYMCTAMILYDFHHLRATAMTLSFIYAPCHNYPYDFHHLHAIVITFHMVFVPYMPTDVISHMFLPLFAIVTNSHMFLPPFAC